MGCMRGFIFGKVFSEKFKVPRFIRMAILMVTMTIISKYLANSRRVMQEFGFIL
jgi:hypothetical protein